jgi:hypothetical protein
VRTVPRKTQTKTGAIFAISKKKSIIQGYFELVNEGIKKSPSASSY